MTEDDTQRINESVALASAMAPLLLEFHANVTRLGWIYLTAYADALERNGLLQGGRTAMIRAAQAEAERR